MATVFVTATQGTLNMNHGDTAYINEGVAIDGNVVMSGNNGGNETLVVNGSVEGQVDDNASIAGNDNVSLGAGGSIIEGIGGASAIFLEGGGNTIFNAGLIESSGGIAIQLVSTSGNADGTTETITNTGTIVAGPGTDAVFETGISAVHLNNAGDVFGDIALSTGSDTINNTGLISGNVVLGGGSNVFDSRLGILEGSITALGGVGNDNIIHGSAGDDTITTGGGNDFIDGSAGADTMSGGLGNDTYVIDNSGGFITDSGGTDTVRSSISFDLSDSAHAIGTFENLFLTGTDAINATGTDGDNVIKGNSGNNILGGLGGNDQMTGGGGADKLFGGDGGDTLDGGRGADTMSGGAGNDSYAVDNAGDVVNEAAAGSGGIDEVHAFISFSLSDKAHAKGAIENLFLASNNDFIDATGNGLANQIEGGGGANVIDGKGGNDILFGLGGADTFAFTTALNAVTNVDTIQDFVHGTDKIELDHAIFTGLAGLGALSSANFALNAAVTTSQHIIYNTTTGALSYDADGSGSGAAIQFATLSGAPGVNETDFFVV